jgi:NAD(P)-dependent dehydrogenase (short-subunit alcohol dehydrogenase family)
VNWESKNIIVTGGTRGIDRAIALALLNEGVKNLVVAAEEETPFEWVDLEARGAHYLRADMGSETAPGWMVHEAHQKLGRLDGLVHCAGVYLEGSPGDRDEVEIWNETMNIKARGGYLLANAFAELAEPGSSFLAITSINADQSEPDHLAYDPACAALGGVIRAFAIHHAPRLRFNALAPGLIHTRLTEEVADSSEMQAHACNNIPLGKLGTPEDCAGAALFLLSDESRYITGETLFVDGGIRANQMSRD